MSNVKEVLSEGKKVVGPKVKTVKEKRDELVKESGSGSIKESTQSIIGASDKRVEKLHADYKVISNLSDISDFNETIKDFYVEFVVLIGLVSHREQMMQEFRENRAINACLTKLYKMVEGYGPLAIVGLIAVIIKTIKFSRLKNEEDDAYAKQPSTSNVT